MNRPEKRRICTVCGLPVLEDGYVFGLDGRESYWHQKCFEKTMDLEEKVLEFLMAWGEGMSLVSLRFVLEEALRTLPYRTKAVSLTRTFSDSRQHTPRIPRSRPSKQGDPK